MEANTESSTSLENAQTNVVYEFELDVAWESHVFDAAIISNTNQLAVGVVTTMTFSDFDQQKLCIYVRVHRWGTVDLPESRELVCRRVIAAALTHGCFQLTGWLVIDANVADEHSLKWEGRFIEKNAGPVDNKKSPVLHKRRGFITTL